MSFCAGKKNPSNRQGSDHLRTLTTTTVNVRLPRIERARRQSAADRSKFIRGRFEIHPRNQTNKHFEPLAQFLRGLAAGHAWQPIGSRKAFLKAWSGAIRGMTTKSREAFTTLNGQVSSSLREAPFGAPFRRMKSGANGVFRLPDPRLRLSNTRRVLTKDRRYRYRRHCGSEEALVQRSTAPAAREIMRLTDDVSHSHFFG